jgi:hypothetical protein
MIFEDSDFIAFITIILLLIEIRLKVLSLKIEF